MRSEEEELVVGSKTRDLQPAMVQKGVKWPALRFHRRLCFHVENKEKCSSQSLCSIYDADESGENFREEKAAKSNDKMSCSLSHSLYRLH